MKSNPASASTRAAKLQPEPQALPEDAKATENAKMERILRGMVEFEEEQGTKPAPIVPCGRCLRLTSVSSGQSLYICNCSTPLSSSHRTTKVDIRTPLGHLLRLKFPQDRRPSHSHAHRPSLHLGCDRVSAHKYTDLARLHLGGDLLSGCGRKIKKCRGKQSL